MRTLYPRTLTWVELRNYVKHCKGPLVIPIGSVESHGAHLPIDTDTLIASFVADELAKRNGWVSLPPITYSIAIPVRVANVRVEPKVFSRYLESVLKHFLSFGQKEFIVILGHGGHEMKKAIEEACSSVCSEGASIAVFHVSKALKDLGLVNTEIDRHAGWWETSLVMALDPNLVKDLRVYEGVEDLRALGVYGNPFEASREKGFELINELVNYISKFVYERKLSGCFFNWRS